MNLHEIQISNYSSINCRFLINEESTVLFAKFSGLYGIGSSGNTDGLYMFSAMVSYYFIFEPEVIIIDLIELDYQWGNTLLKALNFFVEIGRDEYEIGKKIIVITSLTNKKAIINLLEFVNSGNRILCDNVQDALQIASLNMIQ